jgi:hypothetical protein
VFGGTKAGTRSRRSDVCFVWFDFIEISSLPLSRSVSYRGEDALFITGTSFDKHETRIAALIYLTRTCRLCTDSVLDAPFYQAISPSISPIPRLLVDRSRTSNDRVLLSNTLFSRNIPVTRSQFGTHTSAEREKDLSPALHEKQGRGPDRSEVGVTEAKRGRQSGA